MTAVLDDFGEDNKISIRFGFQRTLDSFEPEHRSRSRGDGTESLRDAGATPLEEIINTLDKRDGTADVLVQLRSHSDPCRFGGKNSPSSDRLGVLKKQLGALLDDVARVAAVGPRIGPVWETN